MAGTMNWADVYGEESSPIQMAAPISAGGPNQSFVNPGFSSSPMVQGTGPSPAFSLLGMVLLLVGLRVVIMMNED